MYTSFFGLSDIPFSIAPNPDFLFLGDRHKEALSHLTYGLGDTGGFVLLTGEVGTGKTTLSRRLLEQLPENTQVAFILNPTLSCLELLATICDELAVRYKKTGLTLKYLTDKIQQKLLSNQEANINTLLIIDEAQHLQPEVLEQLRLLTNLETNTKKLLQVVLIGQPELQQLLQRRDLRQLAQRITARYHLLPLTQAEVAEYIKHRLAVADCYRPLFKLSAIRHIHKISKGIPRLINLLCDRALATAYGNNESVVTRKTVQIASEQALGSEYHLTPWWRTKAFVLASIVANLALFIVLAFWLHQTYLQPKNTIVAVNAEQSVNADNREQSLTTSENDKKTDETGVDDNVLTAVQPVKEASENSSEISKEKSNEQITEMTIANNADIAATNLATSNENRAELKLESNDQTQNQTVEFDVSQLDSSSQELLAKLQQAVEESDEPLDMQDDAEPLSEQLQVPSLLDMPARVQNKVPAMQFEVHIYATDGNGWVRVNGRERYEGDTIAANVTLVKIMQNSVILEMDNEQFSLPALSSW
ncbi:AAA family ATPase [Colwellia sp. MEBiC06753]